MLNQLKHWLRDLTRYPAYHAADAAYDEYWSHRDMSATLNAFQRARVDYLTATVADRESILDVGCGDGRILAELKRRKPGLRVSGIDSSEAALEYARRRAISATRADIRIPASIIHEPVDWILLLEVLEHMPNSEELLAWAVAHGRKGVVVSVPNTGFIVHRLRLLFGRFPLQWRAHPSEHVRFWTLRDMHWWLNALGYRYKLQPYEGVPGLNLIWPSMFAAVVIVRVLPDAK
jgi:2-polyprenyl-3-methyl-5-hydroxy-6-metoxy-1,4-benzoquinol methylase